MRYLPQSFRFSPKITVISVLLASVMVWCSFWQWGRYVRKVQLVETYSQASQIPPLEFPVNARSVEEYQPFVDRRVRLKGRYDYDHEVIVTNKKHATGPGHFLLTPLKIEGSDKTILVSRGFIPFEDRTRETWAKYRFGEEEELTGVLKAALQKKTLGPSNPDVGEGKPFQIVWYYEEIGKMAQQLPYPVITDVYLQRIGGPPSGQFPAERISIEVPPSTHFGYTIEWALLAFATLAVGFLLQAFPWYRGAGTESAPSAELSKEA